MNIYTEAMEIAKEALENAEGCFDTAFDYIHETVDGHESVSITTRQSNSARIKTHHAVKNG